MVRVIDVCGNKRALFCSNVIIMSYCIGEPRMPNVADEATFAWLRYQVQPKCRAEVSASEGRAR